MFLYYIHPRTPIPSLFPYTTLFRSFVKRGDLGRDRDEQRPERFQVGQHFDAMVIGFDRSKKPNFSVKALQIAEEKQAVAQYRSEEHTSELQSRRDLVCSLLLEKNNN